MCRPPFCYFCGEAKVGPRGSDALGITAEILLKKDSPKRKRRESIFQKIAAESPAAQTTSIEEKFPLRQRPKKMLPLRKHFNFSICIFLQILKLLGQFTIFCNLGARQDAVFVTVEKRRDHVLHEHFAETFARVTWQFTR